jgi:hypothetical protein
MTIKPLRHGFALIFFAMVLATMAFAYSALPTIWQGFPRSLRLKRGAKSTPQRGHKSALALRSKIAALVMS